MTPDSATIIEPSKNSFRPLKTALAIAVSSVLITSFASANSTPLGEQKVTATKPFEKDGITIKSGGHGLISDQDGEFIINLKNSDITATGKNTGAIYIDGRTTSANKSTTKKTGNITISLENTSLTHNGSEGGEGIYVAPNGKGDITITLDEQSSIDVSKSGENGFGIAIQADETMDGDITINNQGNISTGTQDNAGNGKNKSAILVSGKTSTFAGNTYVGNSGALTTNSDNSHGILININNQESGTTHIENSGNINTYGAGSNGIQLDNVNHFSFIDNGIGGDILAADTAIKIGNLSNNAMIFNTGILASNLDKILIVDQSAGENSLLDFNNNGEMTGYITINGDADVQMTNAGIWNIQDRNADSAIVSLGNNDSNTITNTGTINLKSERAEIIGLENFNMDAGVLNFTAFESGHSTAHIEGTFNTGGGEIVFNLHNDEADTSTTGIKSDNLYLDSVNSDKGVTGVRFEYADQNLGTPLSEDDIHAIFVRDNSADGAFKLNNDVFIGNYSYELVHRKDAEPSEDAPVDEVSIDDTLPTEAELKQGWHLATKQDVRPDIGLDMGSRDSVINSMTPGLGNGLAPNGITGSGFLRSALRLGVLGQKSNALWAFGTRSHAKGGIQGKQVEYHSDTYTLQVGADRGFDATENGWLELGAMAFMSNTDLRAKNHASGLKAKGTSDGYGFGLYGTYYFDANDKLSPYVDGFAVFGRYKNTNKTYGNHHYNYKANAFSFTLTGGYPIQISESVVIDPQIQATYVDYKTGNYVDHNNASVNSKTDGHFIGRVGAYAIMNAQNPDFQPYAAMNVWYDDTRSKVGFGAGTDFISNEKRGLFYEAKVGFQAKSSERMVYWGEVSAKMGKNNYRDYEAAAGIKYLW